MFAIGINSSNQNSQKLNVACRMTSQKVKKLINWAQNLTNSVYFITAVKLDNIELKSGDKPNNFVSLANQIT